MKENVSGFPWCRWWRGIGKHRRNRWKHSVLVDSSSLPRQGHQGSNQSSIACQCWLRVVAVRPNVIEPVVLIRPRHHCTDDCVRICLPGLPPFPPPSFAAVPRPLLWNRCSSMMNMLRVVGAKSYDVAHAVWISTQNVIDLEM